MAAGPETASIINEVGMTHSPRSKCNDTHHEQIVSIQNRCATNVRNVVDVFNQMGNPFAETSFDLFAIETKVNMNDGVIQSIKRAEESRRDWKRAI